MPVSCFRGCQAWFSGQLVHDTEMNGNMATISPSETQGAVYPLPQPFQLSPPRAFKIWLCEQKHVHSKPFTTLSITYHQPVGHWDTLYYPQTLICDSFACYSLLVTPKSVAVPWSLVNLGIAGRTVVICCSGSGCRQPGSILTLETVSSSGAVQCPVFTSLHF